MRAAKVALTSEQHATLRSWLAAGRPNGAWGFRAQIIPAVAAELSNRAGVADALRSGRPNAILPSSSVISSPQSGCKVQD